MVQLSATMEQTRETQLAQLYDVLGFRRVIARYDVLSTLHETGPWTVQRLAVKGIEQLVHPFDELSCVSCFFCNMS